MIIIEVILMVSYSLKKSLENALSTLQVIIMDTKNCKTAIKDKKPHLMPFLPMK